MKTRLLLRFLPVVILVFFAAPAFGQGDGYSTNSNLRGVVQFGSYQFSDIDNINLASGTVNLRIALGARKGRGDESGLAYVYSSKIWIVRPIPDPNYPNVIKWMAWEPTQELQYGRIVQIGQGTIDWTEQTYECQYVTDETPGMCELHVECEPRVDSFLVKIGRAHV